MFKILPETLTMRVLNRWFTSGFYALTSLIGSVSSLFIHAAFIWALFRLGTRRFPLARDSEVRLAAIALSLYPLSELLSVVVNGRGVAGLVEVAGQLVFLAVLPVATRLRLNPAQDILQSAGTGAALGGLFALILSLIQLLIMHMGRAEAGLGNAGVLAVAALVFAIVACAAYPYVESRYKRLLQAGVVCALAALLLSGMRAVWIAAPFALLAACWPMLKGARGGLKPALLWKWAAVGILLVVVCAPLVFDRIMAGVNDVANAAATGQTGDSLGHRLQLWEKGWQFFLERPLAGYGPDMTARMTGMAFGSDGSGYSHFHNFIMTALMRGGLPELLALLAMPALLIVIARRAATTPIHAAGHALLIATVIGFFCARAVRHPV